MKRKSPTTIPTFLAVTLLAASVFLGVLFIDRFQTFFLKASGEVLPQQVKITNISDSSFTVSWITQSPAAGFIAFGENTQLGQTSLDDREKGTQTSQPQLTHYVTLENLKPSTKYFFKISSGGKIFDNSGKPYEVTTGPVINLPLPTADTAFGIILEPGGNPSKGAVVYLSLANTTPLSSLVKNDGSWVIPLSMARNLSLTSYSSYDRELQVEEIFVQGGSLGTATAITTTKNDSPVPTLILGQTYDFRQTAPSPSATPVQQIPSLTPLPTKSSLGFPLEPLVTSPSTGLRLNILNPSEGEKVNTQKPEFIGTAPQGEVLDIIVESETTFSGQTLVGEKGNWQWTPPTNLPPGEHKITVTLKDKSGITQKVTRSFTVLAAGEGELPSFTATPSGQLTVPPTPEPTRIIATPTEPPAQPKPGSLTTTFLFFTIGLIALVFGFYQFKSL